MPVISIFSGTHCSGEAVVRELLSRLSFQLIQDADIVSAAAELSGIAEEKVAKAFEARTSVFNNFTHEKERSIALLKLALAERMASDNLLVTGFVSHLIPHRIQHVLRVCLIADHPVRLEKAMSASGLSKSEATRLLNRQDEDALNWVSQLRGNRDPWDVGLYDIVAPMGKLTPEQAADLIQENVTKSAVQATDASRRAVEDFRLAARTETELSRQGHNVEVDARNGEIVLTINKNVLMLGRLEKELTGIASKVPGVERVTTQVGKQFHQADIYRQYDFQAPSKVLLVDDEREFVQTLSERLMMRDFGSAVAYDGESALTMVDEDEPEVMILDLKMPGIDGIEVLKRVKQTQPQIEVIILTGHGSEADRETCMGLGAFAYLSKPVDIEELSDTIRRANAAIQERKRGKVHP
ncbi:MAG: response regulator [Desulfobacterales bacterium]